ncbi:hypothetical protein KFL_002470170 [Klebsormidium nitens]|uniref:Uncharacterized protein n=1 Tax=Klebsormidium nitens TaxID=105231 RepID=A0A1Y1IC44_KLENI|nr:hypothetical protein KFL_002470170 [Klebsormidium nitens]|eukprot:GAQ85658.1 hypothetical protein KFL_002470170 [Klebsormidium nitens]
MQETGQYCVKCTYRTEPRAEYGYSEPLGSALETLARGACPKWRERDRECACEGGAHAAELEARHTVRERHSKGVQEGGAHAAGLEARDAASKLPKRQNGWKVPSSSEARAAAGNVRAGLDSGGARDGGVRGPGQPRVTSKAEAMRVILPLRERWDSVSAPEAARAFFAVAGWRPRWRADGDVRARGAAAPHGRRADTQVTQRDHPRRDTASPASARKLKRASTARRAAMKRMRTALRGMNTASTAYVRHVFRCVTGWVPAEDSLEESGSKLKDWYKTSLADACDFLGGEASIPGDASVSGNFRFRLKAWPEEGAADEHGGCEHNRNSREKRKRLEENTEARTAGRSEGLPGTTALTGSARHAAKEVNGQVEKAARELKSINSNRLEGARVLAELRIQKRKSAEYGDCDLRLKRRRTMAEQTGCSPQLVQLL